MPDNGLCLVAILDYALVVRLLRKVNFHKMPVVLFSKSLDALSLADLPCSLYHKGQMP